MGQYVVGTDGSAGSDAALRWAAHLAAVTGADLVAVNAYRRRFAEMSPDELDRELTERRTRLAADWGKPATDLGIDLRTIVHEGDPRTMFDEADADLVVLGRTGHGSEPGLFHAGSVVEHVAHHVSVPLAVIQPYRSPTVNLIVLGVDGSTESEAAVRWTAALAPALQAEVVAVHVDEDSGRRSGSADQRAASEAAIEAWVEPITDVTVTPLDVCDLHPADALVGIAARHRGSLLVIGTRGIGGFTGLRLGGVAMKVLHRATTDLVLVPPGHGR